MLRAAAIGLGICLAACSGGGNAADASAFEGTWTLTSGMETATCGTGDPQTTTDSPNDVMLDISSDVSGELKIVFTESGNSCTVHAIAVAADTATFDGTQGCVNISYKHGTLMLAAGMLSLVASGVANPSGESCTVEFSYDFS